MNVYFSSKHSKVFAHQSNIPYFFTFWSLIIMLFAIFFRQFFDLLFIWVIVFIVGFYLSYVDPGYGVLKINDNRIEINGLAKLLIVDLTHILILVLAIVFKEKNPDMIKSLTSFLLILVYLALFDLSIYEIKDIDVAMLLGFVVAYL